MSVDRAVLYTCLTKAVVQIVDMIGGRVLGLYSALFACFRFYPQLPRIFHLLQLMQFHAINPKSQKIARKTSPALGGSQSGTELECEGKNVA